MTEVVPFRGIIFNTKKVKGDDIISPPYDITTPEIKEMLYKKSPFNIVRIDFGKDFDGDNNSVNRYTRAQKYLKQWLSDGILIETEHPAFYLCEVEYTLGTEKRVMRGIFARLKITELCEGIYPHEATYSKPKADRLNLLRYCKANISPIFSIYNYPERTYNEIFERIMTEPPYIISHDLNNSVHKMWILDNPQDVIKIQEQLKGIPIYIADGHHRYETALEYRNEIMDNNPAHTGNEPYNCVLMYLVNMAEGGLTILPTHRLIKNLPNLSESKEDLEIKILKPLEQFFEIIIIDGDIITVIQKYEHALGLAIHGKNNGYILLYKGHSLSDISKPLRELDVTVLHELIFKRLYNSQDIDYEMDPKVALQRVRKGEYKAAFFLNPTRVDEVERVALACLRMPPKSTYFYPKILTGLVINRLE